MLLTLTGKGEFPIFSKGKGISILAIGLPSRSKLLKLCELAGKRGSSSALYIP